MLLVNDKSYKYNYNILNIQGLEEELICFFLAPGCETVKAHGAGARNRYGALRRGAKQ